MATNVFTIFAALKADTSDYDKSIENAKNSGTSALSTISSGVGKAAKVAFTAAAAAVGTATVAVTKLASESVSAYANYEQLVGGVETLFGAQGMSLEEYAESINQTVSEAKSAYEALTTAQNTVMENASNAWQTAGLSANDYMETVTSFAAALKQSTADEVEAAEKADIAVQDMADNANKMGTSMESIQNAYNGFAKQNYTMLDNLKLGYGGTKDEMERLLADAQELSGVEYDIDNLSDVYDAIHVIQQELGITGTTAKEAMHTISGAASATKAAWQNVITAIAGGGDLDEAMDGLITGIFGDGTENSGLLANVIPRIQTVMEGIGTFIGKAAPYITEYLPKLVDAVLPSAIEAISSLVGAIVQTLPEILQTIWDTIKRIAEEALGALGIDITPLTDAIDGLIQKIVRLFESANFGQFVDLINGLIEVLGFLIDHIEIVATVIAAFMVLEAVVKVVTFITTVVSAISSLISIIGGVVSAIGTLATPVGWVVAAIAGIIAVVALLVTHWDDLKKAMSTFADWAGSAFKTAIEGIKNFLTSALEAITGAFKSACDTIKSVFSAFGDGLKTVWNGIKDMFTSVGNAISDFFSGLASTWSGILNTIQNAFDNAGTILSNVFTSLQTALSDAWTGIQNVISTVGNAISNIMSGLASTWSGIWNGITNAISSFANTASGIFQNLKNTWESIWSGIGNIFSGFIDNFITPIIQGFQNIGDAITTAFEGVGNIVSSIWDGITGTIKGAINGILGFINGLISGVTNGLNAVIGVLNKLSIEVPSWVPLIGGETLGFNIDTLTAPEIPLLAEGGVTTRSGSAIVGEAGAELVNLPSGASVTPLNDNNSNLLGAMNDVDANQQEVIDLLQKIIDYIEAGLTVLFDRRQLARAVRGNV